MEKKFFLTKSKDNKPARLSVARQDGIRPLTFIRNQSGPKSSKRQKKIKKLKKTEKRIEKKKN